MKLLLPLLLLCASVCTAQISFRKGSLAGPTTIARLPLIGDSNILWDIRNAANATDCTVGGGTTRVVCKWNGASYAVVGGSGASGAPTDATYITQTANGSLSAEQALGSLATGILKNTTTTGVLSVAIAGDFPTLNQNTSGTAANLSGTPALPNGTTATTQSQADASTKLATTAYVDTGLAGKIRGSVGLTDNCVPRADGTGGLTLQGSGVCIDDSNNITTPAQIFAPDGVSVSAPSFSFSSAHDTGMWLRAGSVLDLAVAGIGSVELTGTYLRIPADSVFAFSNTAGTAIAAPDTGLSRNAAGVVESNNGTSGTLRDFKGREFVADATVTAGGTTGAQTINKSAFSVNFAAAATSLVVTNSLVTASSIIVCTVSTNDTTFKSVQAVPTSGSLTLFANAAATAETRVSCWLTN